LISRFVSSFHACALGLVLIAGSLLTSEAAEVISRFNSVIEVASDGGLTVTETIRVRAEGRKIRRGIYRDIPLRFEDVDGKLRQVGFDLISVKRDGRSEPHFTERDPGFIRIYIGDKDVLLPHGPYTYEIKYRTDRQIRFFDTYDEIFWNATGNGWDFPIEDASAVVVLPEGARSQDTVFYTGPQGSRARNARVFLEENGNRAVFSLTAPLAPREGLTVGVKMPKGVILPPSTTQEGLWFWRENGASIMAMAILAIVLFYYYWAWHRVGRDPPKGTVIPRWDAPDGISPALSAYIHDKGFSGSGWSALSGAAINLAVKGFVILDNLSSDLIIRGTGKSENDDLPVGEYALFNQVGENGEVSIDKGNSSKVKRLHTAFINSIESEHRSVFYKANVVWIIIGFALSIVGLAILFISANLDSETLGILLFSLIFGAIFMAVTMTLGKSLFRSSGLVGKLKNLLIIGVIGIVAIPNILVHAAAIFFDPREPFLIAAIAGLVMVNVLFFFLLGAPTPIGRKMMDGIEGLKTYLQLAEKDRMNLIGAPTMSPSHFETLLPYAVALGVEKPWSDAFEGWLASAAGAEASGYSPHWQQGFYSPGRNIGRSFAAIGPSMSSSFTASMPAPKSSSSGFSSGGSSGGGGGGGGGGGW